MMMLIIIVIIIIIIIIIITTTVIIYTILYNHKFVTSVSVREQPTLEQCTVQLCKKNEDCILEDRIEIVVQY